MLICPLTVGAICSTFLQTLMRVSVSVTGRCAMCARTPMCDDEPAVTMKMSALDVGPPRRLLHLDTRMSTCEPDASNLLIVAKLLRRSSDGS